MTPTFVLPLKTFEKEWIPTFVKRFVARFEQVLDVLVGLLDYLFLQNYFIDHYSFKVGFSRLMEVI